MAKKSSATTKTQKSPKKIKPLSDDDLLPEVEETELTAKDLTPASYNPRTMTEEARKALKVSMKEFNDISGITWNRVTRNIVTGHHRWANLIEAHGIENLTFEAIDKDLSKIMAQGEYTGFILRTVDWSLEKEKAANVAANSTHISGQFTADLQNILADIQNSEFSSLYTELSFQELEVSGMDLSDYETSPATHGADVKDKWESNIAKIDKMDAENREMFDVITIAVKKGKLEEVKEAVKKAIEGLDAQIR